MQRDEKILKTIIGYANTNFEVMEKWDIFPSYDYHFDEVFKFRKDNSETIKRLIKKKLINKVDYNWIKKSFDIFYNHYTATFKNCVGVFFDENEWSIFDKLEPINYLSINPIFYDICKNFIALSLQHNEKIIWYLKIFNPNDSYYKKMKALSLIRFSNYGIDEYESLFWDISDLLQDAVNKDQTSDNINDCVKISIEYLSVVFTTKYRTIYERINYINNNWNADFINTLRSNSYFKRRFENLNDYNDEILKSDWLDRTIKEMLQLNELKKWSTKTMHEIKTILKPYFEEYQLKVRQYKLINREYRSIDDEIAKILPEISDLERKYHLTDYDILFYVDKSEDILETIKERIIRDDIEENSRVKIGLCYEETEENITKLKNDLEQIFKFNFSFTIVPDDLNELLDRESELSSALWDQSPERFQRNKELEELAIEIIWNVYKICNSKVYTINSKTKTKEINYETKLESKEASKSEDMDDDKKDIKNVKESADNLDSSIASLKTSLDFYLEKNHQLHEEINYLKDVLKKNNIKLINEDSEEELKQSRKDYKILFICWNKTTVKRFNYLEKKKDFWDNIKNDYNLTKENFILDERGYNAQQNKNYARDIENKLEFWKIDFIIAAVTDHETQFKDLLDSWKYKSQITYFWETDDELKINKDNQNFTFDKFERYLKKAIEKYEDKQINDLIWLD